LFFYFCFFYFFFDILYINLSQSMRNNFCEKALYVKKDLLNFFYLENYLWKIHYDKVVICEFGSL
jgi:hypothetical protein